jgi:hypothetical protein
VHSLLFRLFTVPSFAADTMPPAADQQLARDIYKQLIEINGRTVEDRYALWGQQEFNR